MLNNGKIKVKVWDKEFINYTDITDGILSISTQTGVDYFQGFWDTIEPGQFTIVSRNPNLDPYKTNLIRQGSLIEITVEKLGLDPNNPNLYVKPIFIGFITDFNIEYRKDDKPLTTINGTDYLGVLNRTLITQELMDEKVLPIFPDGVVPFAYLINDVSPINPYLVFQYASRAHPPGFLGNYTPYEEELPLGPSVKLEVGKNFLDAINEGVSSGLIELNNLCGSIYAFYPFYKYDPVYYYVNSLEDTALDYWIFKSHNPQQEIPGDIELSYKFININDGFDRTVNQVSVTNTDPATGVSEEFETAFNLEQIAEWGPMNITASTTFNPDMNFMRLSNNSIANQVARYQQDILDYQSVPEIEINSITVDMINQYYNTEYGFYVNYYLPEAGSLFEIEHKIDEDTTINRKLIVCGVKHQITVDSWNAEFVLRKSQDYYAQDNKLKKPIINLPKTTGTSGETFTASISNYDSADWAKVARVEWMVCIPEYLYIVNPPSHYKYNYLLANDWGENTFFYTQGKEFQNAPIFTNQTVSWNYDDGGPLAGYYNPNDPMWNNVFVGPGQYHVYAWVTSHDGHVTRSDPSPKITVTTANAFANFIATKDQYEVVTFTDLSGSDTNTWQWNFGDGTTFNGQNPPKKVYNASGTYTITLTVNNGFDQDTIQKQVTIVEANIPVRYIKWTWDETVTKPAGQAQFDPEIIAGFGGFAPISSDGNINRNPVTPLYTINGPELDGIWSGFEAANNAIPFSYKNYIYSGSNAPYLKLKQKDTFSNRWFIQYSGDVIDSDGDDIYTPMNATTIQGYANFNTMNIGWDANMFVDNTLYVSGNDTTGVAGPVFTYTFPNQSYNPVIYPLYHPKTDPMVMNYPIGDNSTKYFFIPKITTNPDGSQTKKLKCEMIAEYSMRYEPTPVDGGLQQFLLFWTQWNSTNQKFKLARVDAKSPFFISDVQGYATTKASSLYTVYNVPDTNLNANSYAPITVSVSPDGVTYRKIGEFVYDKTLGMRMIYHISGTTSPTGTMPPKTTLPLL